MVFILSSKGLTKFPPSDLLLQQWKGMEVVGLPGGIFYKDEISVEESTVPIPQSKVGYDGMAREGVSPSSMEFEAF